MAKLFLLEGPVGAGKSTFGLKLAKTHQTILLSLDDWMASLFSPDRPETGVMEWYVARKQRCIEQIFKLALAMNKAGQDVVLELGLIQSAGRLAFYERMRQAGMDFEVLVLEPSKEVRKARVIQRNEEKGETWSMHVPMEIFEMASDLWETPDADEIGSYNVRLISVD